VTATSRPAAHRLRLADAKLALRHVFLRDMVLQASVGVHAFEHQAPQRIRINVDLAVSDRLEAEPGAAGLSRVAPGRDELSRVVDYEAVAKSVRAIVAAGHVSLLETLAERVAIACLADSRVQVVRISIEKLDIFEDTASVGVEIERVQLGDANQIPGGTSS
jgi:dihydroneopterin aldolase